MIIEQGSSNFPQLAEGLHEVVIAEVREVQFDDKPFNATPAQIEEIKAENGGVLPKKTMLSVRFADEEGNSAERLFKPSLHEKASFTKVIVLPLFGSIPAKFDTASLVGTQARVLVVEKPDSKGRMKATAETVMKPSKNQAVPVPASAKKSETAPVEQKAAAKKTAAKKTAPKADVSDIDPDLGF